MKTKLSDRVLWYDGTSQVDAEQVPSLLLGGADPKKIVVSNTSDDIIQFNLLADEVIETTKVKNEQFSKEWLIPVEYLEIDLDKYFYEKVSDDQRYIKRLAAELIEIKERELELLFQTLIYIVDTFKKNNQVWGVGRGSSCAALTLYLIGLHKVDPVKYNIPLDEFFHD